MSVTEAGKTSDERLVLCPRGDRLVGLVFTTIEASTLGPARTEIESMIDSIQWRRA